MDDQTLLRLRAEVGFTQDDAGRLLLTNEPRIGDRQAAPRLWLGVTRAGPLLRCHATAPELMIQELAALVQRQPALAPADTATVFPPDDAFRMAPGLLSDLRAALAAHFPVTREWGGPCYSFPAELPSPGGAERLTAVNRMALRDTFPWLYDELDDWWPCFAVLREGAAVSVCFSSRRGDRAAEAGVETLADFRGRGYALSVTAAWAAATRAGGRIPFYSTAWDNVASRAVARRLGLLPFGSDRSWV